MATTATSNRESVRVAVVGACPADLWGISSAERLRRQLKAIGQIRLCDAAEAVASGEAVLLLRADYLFEDRTISDLLAAGNVVLRAGAADRAEDAPVVAVRAEPGRGPAALAAAQGSADWREDPLWSVATVESLSSAYIRKLRKATPPQLWQIRPDRVGELEAVLFGNSYKGVTDLVTKYVWPRPARLVTKLCAVRGIGPNAVTSASLVLVAIATVLFAQGWFLSGLALAWIMTFLDTVDGKLARVTVTSTEFGNIFDHAIDLFGPPVWYVAWAWGLPESGIDRVVLLEMIMGGYIAGRLVEGAFNWWVGGFSIFIWRPLDSWLRLIIARRNPNLIFLTGFALAELPSVGLKAVAAWTVVCTVFLLGRLAVAIRLRLAGEPLQPWLQAPTAADMNSPLARPFL